VPFLRRKPKTASDGGAPAFSDDSIHISRRYTLRRGRAHIIEEHQGSLSYEIMSDLVSGRGSGPGMSGLIVSRQHPNLLRSKYGFEGVSMIWLATQAGDSTLDPTSLGILARSVEDFLSKNPGGVVLVDGIEYLMTNNDFRKVARTLEQISDSVMDSRGILLMAVDPRAFDPRELAILERDLEVIHPRGAPGSAA